MLFCILANFLQVFCVLWRSIKYILICLTLILKFLTISIDGHQICYSINFSFRVIKDLIIKFCVILHFDNFLPKFLWIMANFKLYFNSNIAKYKVFNEIYRLTSKLIRYLVYFPSYCKFYTKFCADFYNFPFFSSTFTRKHNIFTYYISKSISCD